MMTLFKDIAKRLASRSLAMWLFLGIPYLFLIEFGRTSNQLAPWDLAMVLGFSTIVSSALVTLRSRWIIFWRRYAKSIKEFWLGVLAVQFLGFAINVLYLTVILAVAPNKPYAKGFFYYWDVIWALIIVLTYCMVMSDDLVARAAIETSMRGRTQVKLIISIIAASTAIFFIFTISRLLGYIAIEIGFLSLFMLKNTVMVNSLEKSVRLQILWIGIFITVTIGAISFQVAGHGNEQSRDFVGGFAPSVRVVFSDLDSVQTPSEWIKWVEHVGDLKTDQKLLALAKLEQLCPLEPTDTPTTIRCYEEHPKECCTSFSSPPDESEIKQLLADSHGTSKLLGLIKARGMDEFPPDIKTMIEDLAKGSGRLSAVAEKTLAHHKKGTLDKMRVSIETKETKK